MFRPRFETRTSQIRVFTTRYRPVLFQTVIFLRKERPWGSSRQTYSGIQKAFAWESEQSSTCARVYIVEEQSSTCLRVCIVEEQSSTCAQVCVVEEQNSTCARVCIVEKQRSTCVWVCIVEEQSSTCVQVCIVEEQSSTCVRVCIVEEQSFTCVRVCRVKLRVRFHSVVPHSSYIVVLKHGSSYVHVNQLKHSYWKEHAYL